MAGQHSRIASRRQAWDRVAVLGDEVRSGPGEWFEVGVTCRTPLLHESADDPLCACSSSPTLLPADSFERVYADNPNRTHREGGQVSRERMSQLLREVQGSLRWRQRKLAIERDGRGLELLQATLHPDSRRSHPEPIEAAGTSRTVANLAVRCEGGPRPTVGWGTLPADCAATVCTRSHLHLARTLVSALSRLHPEIAAFVLLVDGGEEDRLEVPGARVLLPAELDLLSPYDLLKLTPFQACAACKGGLVAAILAAGAQRVVFLDADIDVFARLDGLLQPLAQADLVAVPHLLEPYSSAAYWERPNLVDVTRAGVLNSGLFAASPAAQPFLRLWSTMILAPGAFSEDQFEQTTLAWALAFVDRLHVCKSRQVNVAYWNLHERSLTVTHEETGAASWWVDGEPLVAFHFSGFELSRPDHVSKWDGRHSLWSNPALTELTRRYASRLMAHGGREAEGRRYRYARFPSGIAIDDRMRAVFRDCEIQLREDLDPQSEMGERHYCAALLSPDPRGRSLLPVLLERIYQERPDLQTAMPGARLEPGPMLRWFAANGARETGYELLLAHHRPTVPRRHGLEELGKLRQVSPELFSGGERPLGEDRPELVHRLGAAGYQTLAQAVANLDLEIWTLSPMWLLRDLYRGRPELARAYVDPLHSDADGFAAWIVECGERTDFLPPSVLPAFHRASRGRSLARIHSFLRRDWGLARRWALSLCGLEVEGFAMTLLQALEHQPEFELDDVVTYLWEMEQGAAHGLVLTLELMTLFPPPGSDAISLAEQDAQLAPLLAGNPRMARQLERCRAQQLERGTLPPRWPTRGGGPAVARYLREASGRDASPVAERGVSGVNCFGYFHSPIGLGVMSRGVVAALAAAGVATAEVPLTNSTMDQQLEVEHFVDRFEPRFDANLFVSYPHMETDLFAHHPPAMTRSRQNIAYLAWELRQGHPDWRRAFEPFEQVWALSGFAATALRECLARPVAAVPCCLDLEQLPPPADRAALGFDQRFTVLYVFDAASSLERKNPLAAIAAFARAFRPGDGACLVLRVANGQRRDFRGKVDQLAERARQSGLDIRLITAPLSRREILALVSTCDCYLSPHRAEGFGFTCAEAMAYGRPVIATRYSGNLEFMDDATALLVNCEERPILVAEGPFRRGMVWAEPDVDHAATLLRWVFENRSAALALGERAREMVGERLSPRRIGVQVGGLLGVKPPEQLDRPGVR